MMMPCWRMHCGPCSCRGRRKPVRTPRYAPLHCPRRGCGVSHRCDVRQVYHKQLRNGTVISHAEARRHCLEAVRLSPEDPVVATQVRRW